MKSKLMTAVSVVAALCGFAAEPIAVPTPTPHVMGMDNHVDYNAWRSYVRVGLSNSRPNDLARVFPDLGVGVRMALPIGALDVFTSYTGDNPFSSKEDKSYVFNAPRASYLMYLSPEKNQSLYGGAGVAFGGIKSASKDTTFHGIIPCLSLGYEMNRLQRVSNFMQLDISQPALETSWSSSFVKATSWDLGPIVQFSAGCGF